jgi:uncharacterized membrane protein YbaN (DUF454 family)
MFRWLLASFMKGCFACAMNLKKYFYLAAGWFFVGLALTGVILPILPTTPFLLVAVWAFSRSSPELAERIRSHKTFGPLIRDWQDAGVIPVMAKVLAMLMLTGASVYLWFYSAVPHWAASVAILLMVGIAYYILSRPSVRS